MRTGRTTSKDAGRFTRVKHHTTRRDNTLLGGLENIATAKYRHITAEDIAKVQRMCAQNVEGTDLHVARGQSRHEALTEVMLMLGLAPSAVAATLHTA